MSIAVSNSSEETPSPKPLSDLLQETTDATVQEAIKSLDKNFDKVLTADEFDSDHNGRLDDMLPLTRKLSVQQFSSATQILQKHGFGIRSALVSEIKSDDTVYTSPVSSTTPVTQNSENNLEIPSFLKDFLKTTNEKSVEFVPEYNYQKFFYHASSLHPEVFAEQLRLASMILKSSATTEVYFTNVGILGNHSKEEIDKAIPTEQRDRFHVADERVVTEIWAQDFGEPTGGENSHYISGWTYSPFIGSRGSRGLGNYSEGSELGTPQDRVPFVIQGGNLTKVRLNGKNMVIVGEDDIDDTIKQYREKHSYTMSKDVLMEMYKKTFGADSVLILKDSSLAFHIDQIALFPSDGKVIMPKLIYEDSLTADNGLVREYVETLQENRKLLKDAGFDFTEIPMTWDMIQKYQAFTNSIVITSEGRTKIIMPSFKENEIEIEIKRILTQQGFEIEFSKNTTYWQQGNSHCITGALANNAYGVSSIQA